MASGSRLEHGALLVVVILHQGLVNAHARVVIHIAGLGHADHRMNDQRASDLRSGPLGQFLVDAVQGIASLESHHIVVAHLFQEVSAPAGGVRRRSRKS